MREAMEAIAHAHETGYEREGGSGELVLYSEMCPERLWRPWLAAHYKNFLGDVGVVSCEWQSKSASAPAARNKPSEKVNCELRKAGVHIGNF